jgi:hypothetical protein
VVNIDKFSSTKKAPL